MSAGKGRWRTIVRTHRSTSDAMIDVVASFRDHSKWAFLRKPFALGRRQAGDDAKPANCGIGTARHVFQRTLTRLLEG